MFLCVCNSVTQSDVRQLGRQGIVSPDALILALNLEDDACCGRCADNIDEFVTVAEEEQSGRLVAA